MATARPSPTPRFTFPLYKHYSLKNPEVAYADGAPSLSSPLKARFPPNVFPVLASPTSPETPATPTASSFALSRQLPDPHAKIYKVTNCRLLQDHRIVENSYLWFQNGRIIKAEDLFFTSFREPDEIIDAHGMLVAPGFIDVQINGAFGVDFTTDADSDKPDEELVKDIEKVSKGLLKYGCTSYLPTVVSSNKDVYHRVLPLLRPRAGSAQAGAEILGAHIEGPFIADGKKGAHKPAVLTSAPGGISDFDERYGPEVALKKADNVRTGDIERAVKIITVAPELEGVLDIVPELVSRGITVSIGHSEAKIADAEAAVANGATFITHLFNAMQAFHHRDPGIIGVLGSTHLPIPTSSKYHPAPSSTSPSPTKPDPRPFYGVICDGIHCHPNSVKIAYYSHPRGAVLVTDALSSMGLPPGTYPLAGRTIEVDAQLRAYISGTETLAGSTITIDACIRNFLRFTGCSFIEAIDAATIHPAKLLGIEKRKGVLRVGADADLVFIDDSEGPENFVVKRVFVRGEEVQRNKT